MINVINYLKKQYFVSWTTLALTPSDDLRLMTDLSNIKTVIAVNYFTVPYGMGYFIFYLGTPDTTLSFHIT